MSTHCVCDEVSENFVCWLCCVVFLWLLYCVMSLSCTVVVVPLFEYYYGHYGIVLCCCCCSIV